MNEPREITESFRLDRVLKSSRSAIVFQAADPGSGKVVAIKLIPPAAPEALPVSQARFLAAMEAVAVLSPPGFPPLLDCGFTPDGSAFMVMELVEGTRLDALAAPSPDRILRLVGGAASSLEKLAGKNVAHGNLRPDNLLAVDTGGQEGVAILGFGTAAFQAAAVGAGATEGAASCVAPERLDPATAATEPDWRSDVYSLAFTTCLLLGAEVAEASTATPTVTLPTEVRTRLQDPVVLRAILEQALRRDPDARPASLEEFRQAIEFAVEGVPGREAFVPDFEPEPVAVFVPAAAGAASNDAGQPRGEQTGPFPFDRLPEVPPPLPILEAIPAEPEALPQAVEFLTPVPVSVEAAEPAPEALTPQPAVVPPRGRPKGRSRRGLVLGVAVSVVVLLGAAAVLIIVQGRRSSPQPRLATAPTRAPNRPTTAPQAPSPPPAVAQLNTAEAAIALADLVAARQALDAITQADLEALSAVERERYAALRAAYDAKVVQTVTRALAGSLASGNLKALAETVRGISREDEAAFARNDDLLAALEEARRALNVQALMLKAQRDGDWAGVLRESTVMASLVPRYTQAADLRERAAASLEREADTLADKGNYEVALGRLDTVRRSWPDRRGLSAHIDRLKAEQATAQQVAAVLATAAQAEKDNAPEKGLAALAALSPPPRWQERARQVHDRLAKQLQQLDVAPPTVALLPGSKLEYKKNEPATITLRISDDHAIKSAKLFARLAGSVAYVELPLRPDGKGDYAAEISPAFHQNGTVQFYVVATDFSDHAGQLGSGSDPVELKRKKWRLFGG